MSDASITTTAAARTSPAFQPYGFLLTGGRRQSVHSSSGGLGTPTGAGSHPTSGFPTPATSPADFTVGGSLLSETEHAKALSADLDFIVPPMITPVLDTTQATSPRCLFLGHLRFETTTAEVRWMIKKLCDVDPLRADIRGNGCCVVHLATDKDVVAVRALNRRVLFDHHGFWFARTADAVDRLLDYVESDMPKKKKNMHLPRDALVVEDSRSSKAGHRRHPQQPLQPTSASASSLASKRQHLAPSLDATMSGTMRSAVPTPCKSPMSPCALGSPAYRNFHDSPPDYVHPPSQQMSCRTSPSSHPAMPPPPPPYHALLDSCSSTDVSLTSF